MEDGQKIFYIDRFTDFQNEVLTVQLREASKVLGKWIFDTREAKLREGLIELGWTPPPEKK